MERVLVFDFAFDGTEYKLPVINWRKYKKYKNKKLIYEFPYPICISTENILLWRDIMVTSHEQVMDCVDNDSFVVITKSTMKKQKIDRSIMFNTENTESSVVHVTKYKPCKIFKTRKDLISFKLYQ